MIEVRNLSKSYGDKMVVHDVALKIQKGKIKIKTFIIIYLNE